MNRLSKMTNTELVKALKEYSKDKKGEIAELTHEAAVRIATLEAMVRELEGEDDLK